jgi:hypothetical protein
MVFFLLFVAKLLNCLYSFFQWTAPIPHVLGMVSVQRVSVFARRGGKVRTAARWIAMPFSVSQTVQVMAHLTLRLRLVAVNPCGQEMTALEVSNSIILNYSSNVCMLYSGLFPDVCGLNANLSEHSVPSSWASWYEV